MADSGNLASQQLWGGALKNKSSIPGSLFAAAGPAQPIHPQEAHEEGIERLDGRRIFVAVSPAMREVRRQVEQVAGIDAVVLLLGESGTGKEVIARMIHKLSSRSARKFLKVNCAALPLELLESELFGHEAGAFTGARQARAGKFEICHKGTILLDEIAEMPVSPQAKLLHVLQDGEFSRLGSACTIQSDVRVLAATNVDVRQAVQNGTLRADLYYRLNAFTIQLPPLRERREDLPHLLNHFMTTWAASYGRPRLPITRRILDACASYPWPGNVRELENFVKRYLVLGDEKLAVSQLDFRPGAEPRAGGRAPSRPAPRKTRQLRFEVAGQGSEERCGESCHCAGSGADGWESPGGRQLCFASACVGCTTRFGPTASNPRLPALRAAPPHETPAGPRPISPVGKSICAFPRPNGGKLISMDRAGGRPPTNSARPAILLHLPQRSFHHAPNPSLSSERVASQEGIFPQSGKARWALSASNPM